MKLRTVLSELEATDYALGFAVDLDNEVVAYTGAEQVESFEEMLVLAPVDNQGPDEGFRGITLVYEGHGTLDHTKRPADRTLLMTSELDREGVVRAFKHLPALHAHLDLQYKRLYRAFQSSYDIQHYANRVCEILGNPLLIVNSDRRLLASAGDFPKDRQDVLEEITQGYVSEEVNAELVSAGILDDVRHAGHSIISENKRFGQRWVTSIISYHHMEMGRFDMLEQDQTIRDVDLELVDFAGSLAGVMIDKLGIAGERAGSGSTVLDDLLGASFANEKTMLAQLALSSMPLGELYVLVELVGEGEIPRAHLQRIAARVTHAFRNSLWTIREGRLVVLIALGARSTVGWDAYERAERVLGQRKEFVRVLERNGLRAYVSEPFEQISLAPDRYQQIVDLRGSKLSETNLLMFFWQHRYSVLASMARTFGQVDMMLDKRVIAMNLYDLDHGTSYLDTARKTVEFPGSPAEAAKALNVHRNTYFYRVNKIAELFFLDLKRGEDRLSVAFYIRFLEGMDNRLLFDVDQAPFAWRQTHDAT